MIESCMPVNGTYVTPGAVSGEQRLDPSVDLFNGGSDMTPTSIFQRFRQSRRTSAFCAD
jgi:hypothetical protein